MCVGRTFQGFLGACKSMMGSVLCCGIAGLQHTCFVNMWEAARGVQIRSKTRQTRGVNRVPQTSRQHENILDQHTYSHSGKIYKFAEYLWAPLSKKVYNFKFQFVILNTCVRNCIYIRVAPLISAHNALIIIPLTTATRVNNVN